MRKLAHGSDAGSCHSPGLKVPPPDAGANGCMWYNCDYVRCERIYISTCDDCLKKKAAVTPGFTDEDLKINLEYNHAVLDALLNAIYRRHYFQIVQDLFTHFGVVRRYVFRGCRWVPERTPDPDVLTLGPDSIYYMDEWGLLWMSRNPMPVLEDRLGGWLDQVRSTEQGDAGEPRTPPADGVVTDNIEEMLDDTLGESKPHPQT
ncbi:hypothetical protein GGR52DRAFT_551161 [Hypoxylon sp. FL1284]|nr:hypothetical protein GGR52DRAFT_551161 [Hypoxylon sp. FL1284]